MTAHVDPNAVHAVYAPSSAPVWTICTAQAEAVAAMRRVVSEEEREEAQDGTAAHDEIERCLAGCAATGGDVIPIPVNPDHPAAYGVALFVDYVRQLPPGRMWIEQRVILTPEIWGRCDVAHWHEESATLTIVDYKNGYLGVDAEDNEQLQIYAAASIYTHSLPAKHVRLVVVQPNDFRPVPRVKQHVMSAEQLHERAAVWAAIPGGPKKFVGVGEHCRDCPLFGACEPSKDLLVHIGAMMAKGADEVQPEQFATFLACEKPIEHFFEALWKRGAKLGTAGTVPPGMKIVTSQTKRAWKDEDKARDAVLAAKGIKALKPPTPAQAEDMGIDVSALASKPAGDPALAFESDKRPEWKQKSAAEMFGSVVAGEAGK